jgi:hypothetical protein
MRLSLNLRHDLATLSDAELAERLERTWQAHARAEREASPGKLWASFRGPVRHPLAYPFISWVGVSHRLGRTFGLSSGPAFWLGVQGLLSTWRRALIRMHLALCEARDTTDEMKRRVASRQVAESGWPFARR